MRIFITRVYLLIKYFLNVRRKRGTLDSWKQSEKDIGVVGSVEMPTIHKTVDVFDIELEKLVLWEISLKEIIEEFMELVVNCLHNLIMLGRLIGATIN